MVTISSIASAVLFGSDEIRNYLAFLGKVCSLGLVEYFFQVAFPELSGFSSRRMELFLGYF